MRTLLVALLLVGTGLTHLGSAQGETADDTNTSSVLARLRGELGAPGPIDDLTFGSEGSLIWNDTTQGLVGRRAPDGSVRTQFVAPGNNPIRFSPDGRLFVALDGTVATLSPAGTVGQQGVAVLTRPDGSEALFVGDG